MPAAEQHPTRAPDRRLPRPGRSRPVRIVALLLLALAGGAGCMRSGELATDLIDCGEGALVIIDASALCVYHPEAAPLVCPEPLPNRFERSGAVLCVRQERPAGYLLEQAAARVVGTDGGIFVVDAGQGFEIVDGGATRADF